MVKYTDFKPCPFCGSTDFKLRYLRDGDYVEEKAINAEICCRNCLARLCAHAQNERYINIEDNLYEKLPRRYAEEVLVYKWNTRYIPKAAKQSKRYRFMKRLKQFLLGY